MTQSSPEPLYLPQKTTASDSFLFCGRRDLIGKFKSPKLVQRMLYASAHPTSPRDTWLKEVCPDGRTRCRLYTRASVERAYDRLCAGEYPPLLPSERRRAPQPRPNQA